MYMSHGRYDIYRNAIQRSSYDVTSGTILALRLELIESLACWYELLLNSSEKDARHTLIDQLRAMQAKVNATPMAKQHGHSDFCMVSFLGTRQKIRFCIDKPVKFSMFGKDFIFYVELGRDRVRKKITTTFIDSQTGNAIRPEVELEESFITISFSEDDRERVCIYDFLRKCGLELQVPTHIYSVEYNAYPVERWLEAADRKLTQMLYKVSNEENDFFFYNNLFKVTLINQDQHAYTTGGVPDFPGRSEYAMSLNERGEAIERALNAYFHLPQSNLQAIHKAQLDRGTSPIYTVQMLMELNHSHELYRFASEEVPASDKHMFSCEIEGDEVRLTALE